LSIRCTKQKDYEEFSPITLKAKPIRLSSQGKGARFADTSLVLVPGSGDIGPKAEKQARAMKRLMQLLKSSGTKSITVKQWRQALLEDEVVASANKFVRLRDRLAEKGLIECRDDRVRPRQGA
jgi:hypothetical protein